MFKVAPSSRWQSTRLGFITSMSPVVAIWPAVTSPGPVAESCRRLAWSPSMRSAICFTFKTRSVMSSRTPASRENSGSPPSTRIEVTAAPCSEERRTRRRLLPSVRPKPRSSGSAAKFALRRASPAERFSSALGFFISCQFFALTAMGVPYSGGCRGTGFCLSPSLRSGDTQIARPQISDPAALRRADAVVRDRGDVADRGDLEADRLEGAERALAAGAGALHIDLEHAHAVLLRLAAGILGGHLGGIGRRLAAALETHATGRRPGNGVAL